MIEHRKALIYMLCEAAESLSTGAMCQYLFAAFSLKQSTEEGLSDAPEGMELKGAAGIDAPVEEAVPLIGEGDIVPVQVPDGREVLFELVPRARACT